jgi:hypothetical protein
MAANERLVNEILAILIGEAKNTAVTTETLADAILKLIRDALAQSKNVKTILSENTRRNAGTVLATNNSVKSNIVKVILDIIRDASKGALQKETAKKVVKVAGPPPRNANSVLEVLKRNVTPEEAKKIEEEVAKAPRPTANNTANLIYKLILNLFKNKIPSSPNMVNGPNFVESKKKNNQGNPIFNVAIPGYIFTTRGTPGRTGYYRNTGKPPGPEFGPAAPPPPPTPRNYSGLNLRALFNARRKYPNNKNKINTLIRSKFDSAIRNLKYTTGASLFRRGAEILRILPENYPGRGEIVNFIIDEIRRISRSSNLDAARRNLRNVRNRNVRDELNRKARNLKERRRENETEYRRRRENLERRRANLGRRYEGESNVEYSRRKAEYNRNKEEANRQEMVLRRAARLQVQPLLPPPPPPLPPVQQQAIANAGGVQRAVNTIAAVPGGAPEVAKAAEALNETGGNMAQAVNVKGASPQAVQAVKTLGGVKNTVIVLEGLNTLSQTPETRRRKATKRGRRPKKTGVRLAELNRVINAVKKQKLISLMAHNITRTNNIHPNDEKRKKYYKKVMKSYLLKKPFANIVKKSAKKKM